MVFASDPSFVPQLLDTLVPQRFRGYVPRRFQKYFPESRSQRFARLCIQIGSCCIFLGIFLFTVVESLLYVSSLKKFELSQAQRHAGNAKPVVAFLSTITFHSVPDIEVWNDGLTLGKQLGDLQTITSTISQGLNHPDQASSLTPAIPVLSALSSTTQKLSESIDRSYLAQRFIQPDKRALLTQATEVLTQLDPLAATLLTGKQTWVVIFQNSDELRATGGFAGSYALVTLQDGKLQEIVVEDIYDADGQFSGYLNPPAGVKEYTSSSRGLRLPDANWYPHFPQTAQTMLPFFAFGNKQDIKGLIAVNLSVAEAIVRITGPLTVPDYPVQITADNLHAVLRDERDQFFPGSIQKKHILSQVMTVLRQKLGDLSASQQVAVFSEIVGHARRKEIQVFALNPDLQTLFSRYGVTGELGMNALQKKQFSEKCGTFCNLPYTLFSLVESNVGINKANRFIHRSVTMTEDSAGATVTIEFQNQSPRDEKTLLTPIVGSTTNPVKQIATNGYANYQRLLLSPTFKLEQILIDGKAVNTVDTEPITTDDQTVTQYGFLVIVLPAQTVTVQLRITPTQPGTKLEYAPLFIQKQSGLAPTPYTLQFPNYKDTFVLENDRLITWQ